jgi:hypothetical protein
MDQMTKTNEEKEIRPKRIAAAGRVAALFFFLPVCGETARRCGRARPTFAAQIKARLAKYIDAKSHREREREREPELQGNRPNSDRPSAVS